MTWARPITGVEILLCALCSHIRFGTGRYTSFRMTPELLHDFWYEQDSLCSVTAHESNQLITRNTSWLDTESSKYAPSSHTHSLASALRWCRCQYRRIIQTEFRTVPSLPGLVIRGGVPSSFYWLPAIRSPLFFAERTFATSSPFWTISARDLPSRQRFRYRPTMGRGPIGRTKARPRPRPWQGSDWVGTA